MFAAVVPAQNEAGRISIVIRNLLKLPLTYIIPVVNGCTDMTLDEVLSLGEQRVLPIVFQNPLGIDVPRAVGASYAHKLGADGIIFVDGDMTGDFTSHLQCIITGLAQGIDLALVNCYPYITNRQKLTSVVLSFRGLVNRELGLFRDLGLATPTHGPHGISKKLMENVPLDFLAVPPLVLLGAKRNNLLIKVVTSIPHSLLSSPIRERQHARKIAHTIIGDCLVAVSMHKNAIPSRTYGKHLFDGYHSGRRLDLLTQWSEALGQDNKTFLDQYLWFKL